MKGLPEEGYIRLPQVLSVMPVSRTTWWRGIKKGKFPKSTPLSDGTVGWDVEDIRKLLKDIKMGNLYNTPQVST